MSAQLAAALKLDRDIRLRGGEEAIELPEGFVVRHHGLRDVYDLNCILLPAPLAGHLDAPAVLGLAEQWLDGLEHRQLVVEDSQAGERLAPELIRRGWERRRTVFMALGGDPVRPSPDPRARELSDTELQAVQLAAMTEADFGPDTARGLASRLVAAQAALRAGTTAQGFGAGHNGGLQSTCTLFMDPDSGGRRAAMVEQVWTLQAHRERGLATAVVTAAVRAAREWGADLVVVPADADDWPQLLYAKLGFEPVGTTITLTLRNGSG